MDWKARIRESAMKSGVVLDEDIVEELSDHAGIVYQTMRSDGSAPSEAQQHVIELIDSWCREAPKLRRRSNRTAHVDPPPLRSRRFTGP
jgi:hypothetical protein